VGGCLVGYGHLLIDTLMGARSIIGLREFKQDTPQMRSIDNENMIQAFFPDGRNPAFGMVICVRRLKRSVNDLKALGLENGIKGTAKRAVIVVDQEL